MSYTENKTKGEVHSSTISLIVFEDIFNSHGTRKIRIPCLFFRLLTCRARHIVIQKICTVSEVFAAPIFKV